MNMPRDTPLSRLRQPAYTGANRCLPCTIFNVAIAVVGAAGIAAVTAPSVGAIALCGALGAIWLRGYLVPGTPEFTKRYFPPRVLALFGKGPDGVKAEALDGEAIDPEAYLFDADVLVETPDGRDFAFGPEFLTAWRAAIDSNGTDEATDLTALSTLTGIEKAALSIDWRGGVGFAFADGERIGHWESRAAFRADAAADRVLTDYREDWADRPLGERSTILGALRLFVDECPTCAGPVALEERVVESCCSSYDVIAGRCGGCNARLFEMQLPASLAGAQE